MPSSAWPERALSDVGSCLRVVFFAKVSALGYVLPSLLPAPGVQCQKRPSTVSKETPQKSAPLLPAPSVFPSVKRDLERDLERDLPFSRSLGYLLPYFLPSS
jgi:hypothetical protein